MLVQEVKVVVVYVVSGKQELFDVQFPNGAVKVVDPSWVRYWSRNGFSFSNLSVTRAGIIRVDGNVRRLTVSPDMHYKKGHDLTHFEYVVKRGEALTVSGY